MKYVNWHGLEPVTSKPYEYFGAMFRTSSKRYGEKFRMHATSVYQYRGTSTYFYPRCDLAETNHAVHVVDSLRWNEEGGDYRLIDTDERINESNVSLLLICDCHHGYFVSTLTYKLVLVSLSSFYSSTRMMNLS